MIRKRSLLGAAAAVQLVIFGVLVSTARAQNVEQAPPNAANPAAAGAQPSGGGELQQVVVTGYLIPRIGEGPQPVTCDVHQYIKNTGDQSVTDVLYTVPA